MDMGVPGSGLYQYITVRAALTSVSLIISIVYGKRLYSIPTKETDRRNYPRFRLRGQMQKRYALQWVV